MKLFLLQSNQLCTQGVLVLSDCHLLGKTQTWGKREEGQTIDICIFSESDFSLCSVHIVFVANFLAHLQVQKWCYLVTKLTSVKVCHNSDLWDCRCSDQWKCVATQTYEIVVVQTRESVTSWNTLWAKAKSINEIDSDHDVGGLWWFPLYTNQYPSWMLNFELTLNNNKDNFKLVFSILSPDK